MASDGHGYGSGDVPGRGCYVIRKGDGAESGSPDRDHRAGHGRSYQRIDQLIGLAEEVLNGAVSVDASGYREDAWARRDNEDGECIAFDTLVEYP